MDIYEEIKKPIFALAPMEDVTDTVFRRVVNSVGKPDISYTEFVNVEGLNSKGKERIVHRLEYDVSEKPLVVQLWGINPENFFKASEYVSRLGFSGIDINMGCSVRKVVQKNAGSGLIMEERSKVSDIVKSVKEGSNGLPVSVKTRVGWDTLDLEWIQFLLNQVIDVLTIHGRSARGSESLHANWEYISKCVNLRNDMGVNTLIFGNGDISTLKQAKEYSKRYGVDGVMIGRAVISNPWVFSGREDISQKERYLLLKKHLLLFNDVWGSSKRYDQLKKYLKGYICNFDGASEIRNLFMNINTVKEALEILDTLL